MEYSRLYQDMVVKLFNFRIFGILTPTMNKITIKYFSQAFFTLSDKNSNIFLDPYSKLGDLNPPKLNFSPDILFITHEHPDHNNRDYSTDDTYEISHPGEYDVKGVIAQGISTFHDKKKGEERGFNNVYSINFDGVNFVHLGDLGAPLEKEQIELLGVVDILFVPVGGFFTIDYKNAVDIVREINPYIVIPMHYNTFPAITANSEEFKNRVEKAGFKPIVPEVEEVINL